MFSISPVVLEDPDSIFALPHFRDGRRGFPSWPRTGSHLANPSGNTTHPGFMTVLLGRKQLKTISLPSIRPLDQAPGHRTSIGRTSTYHERPDHPAQRQSVNYRVTGPLVCKSNSLSFPRHGSSPLPQSKYVRSFVPEQLTSFLILPAAISDLSPLNHV